MTSPSVTCLPVLSSMLEHNPELTGSMPYLFYSQDLMISDLCWTTPKLHSALTVTGNMHADIVWWMKWSESTLPSGFLGVSIGIKNDNRQAERIAALSIMPVNTESVLAIDRSRPLKQ